MRSRQRMTEGRGAVNTEAEVMVICSSLLPRSIVDACGSLSTVTQGTEGHASGADVEALDALNDRHGDVRDRPESIAVGQDLLRERHEPRPLGYQEPDGVDEVIRPDVLGVGLVEVEERVAPDDQDRWVLELDPVELDLRV